MQTPRHLPGAPPVDTSSAAWEALYEADDAGWDLGAVSPPLMYAVQNGLLPMGPGLVVGCGTGHEVAWLLRQGFDAHGVDFAPSAVAAARARLPAGDGERISAADFFDLPLRQRGHWRWLFEQTFFCALQPQQRQAYAKTVAALLQPSGCIVALSLRTQFDDRQPYDSLPGDFIALLEQNGLVLQYAQRLDEESHPRRRGRETLLVMRKP